MAKVNAKSPPDVTDDGEGVYRATIDHRDDYVPVQIALAVDDVTELEVTELIDNFSRYADSDALNRLFTPVPDGPSRDTNSFVVLDIEGHVVTLYSDGELTIGERHE